jgi:hypothetical protein
MFEQVMSLQTKCMCCAEGTESTAAKMSMEKQKESKEKIDLQNHCSAGLRGGIK